MLDHQRVQIIHLGTCITTLHRVVPREELAKTIESAFLYGGMSGGPYQTRADLKAQVVAAVMTHLLDTNHIETYRELPEATRAGRVMKRGASDQVSHRTQRNAYHRILITLLHITIGLIYIYI